MSQHTAHCKPGCTTHNGRAMTQHTPGPWKFDIEKKDHTWPGLYQVDTDILAVGFDGEEGIYLDNPADARLIAAAPDLLDELKQLVDLIGHLPENAWGDVQGFDVNHAFSRASKLLASLEG